MARATAALQGPRAWLLLAMLLSRAGGFITSLVLARTVGTAALGTYATIMNTASPLVAPASQAMVNTTTVMASEQQERSTLRSLWQVQALFSLGALGLVLPIALWLLSRAVEQTAANPMPWLLAVAGIFAVVVGQLATPLVSALLHGEGRFRAAGQWAALVSIVTLCAVVPIIQHWGLAGALSLAAVSAALGWLLPSIDLLRRHHHDQVLPRSALIRAYAVRLREAFPSIAGVLLNGGVNWLCTVYLIQRHWGAEGVGMLSIGLQWSTLMLIPATSWGGITLQSLATSHRTRDRATLLAAIRAQLLRNAGVTAMIALLVAMSSHALERLYGVNEGSLWPILAVFSAAAVTASINNVFERLWWVGNRQRIWFAWTLSSLALQLIFTLIFLPHHLAFAGLGVLISGLATTLICTLTLPHFLASLSKEAR
jgi:O-antigen/teichoic acid export membrane protein